MRCTEKREKLTSCRQDKKAAKINPFLGMETSFELDFISPDTGAPLREAKRQGKAQGTNIAHVTKKVARARARPARSYCYDVFLAQQSIDTP
jgi:hypothetical protein